MGQYTLVAIQKDTSTTPSTPSPSHSHKKKKRWFGFGRKKEEEPAVTASEITGPVSVTHEVCFYFPYALGIKQGQRDILVSNNLVALMPKAYLPNCKKFSKLSMNSFVLKA